jgi:hypothetical protein
MKRRVLVVIGLVIANLAILAGQAWADFPWPVPIHPGG